jgi:hypothetical protein
MALVPTPRFAPFWAGGGGQARSSPLPFALCSRLALALLLKPLSRKSFVLGSAVNRSITDRSDARKSSNFFLREYYPTSSENLYRHQSGSSCRGILPDRPDLGSSSTLLR